MGKNAQLILEQTSVEKISAEWMNLISDVVDGKEIWMVILKIHQI